MDIFEELRRAVARAREENDLPDFLAERLCRIADQPERYRRLAADIADLAGQVALYDTYGQTGYMGMGVNNAVLEGSIRRLEEAGRSPAGQ
ncbi:hypothetical protein KIP69_13500 [Geobacter sulfurreducens]|jgi:hypothetical protein|uniref:Uncharacterized protein n=2 Tax=Geobacter TaxID=28231 RepID=A0A0C1QQZ6_9BACT|nr:MULTISPECIES: hypothetical protein [Geobacter]ADI85533.1 hypothetical protein KN400_2721 [Geobacter sulfurreducens KN400]AJY69052.1 hypothetical protein RW64_05260 [Geobacter sulfurreducens]ANA41056.1 hypothetical protein A2G06_13165 [Geobacter anodireducens]KIE43172.1 hypothetical protein SE37_11275 [Geobacter soli]MBE2888190.1 hypothetical protein [Geobacter anodireducens]